MILITVIERSELEGIFGVVVHAQKLCIFAFTKGEKTKRITMNFRINPREAISPADLDEFFHGEHLSTPISLIRRLSPDSLSIMELRNERDLEITEKLLQFPLLAEHVEGVWNLTLGQEFNMTTAKNLFKDSGWNRTPATSRR
jgi:hypothetical protein